jgi:hypothetical protein
MCRQAIHGLVLGLLLAGCSNGNSTGQQDSAPQPRPDTAPSQTQGADAGCDEDAKGPNACIINPGIMVNGIPLGGGSKVMRQPVNPQLCRQ